MKLHSNKDGVSIRLRLNFEYVAVFGRHIEHSYYPYTLDTFAPPHGEPRESIE